MLASQRWLDVVLVVVQFYPAIALHFAGVALAMNGLHPAIRVDHVRQRRARRQAGEGHPWRAIATRLREGKAAPRWSGSDRRPSPLAPGPDRWDDGPASTRTCSSYCIFPLLHFCPGG